MAPLTIADALVKSLIINGCNTVFGVPGIQLYDLMDAFYRESDQIKFISTRHEQGAGYMANGYAHVSGHMGTLVVVPGPGLMNASAAIGTAYSSSNPVFVISGQIPKSLIGRDTGALHEVNGQIKMIEPITKLTRLIDNPLNAVNDIEEGFQKIFNGRKRPVEIEIPTDMFSSVIDEGITLKRMDSNQTFNYEENSEMLQMIIDAKRPLLWVGKGNALTSQLVTKLSELINAPVFVSGSGKGMIADDHPLSLGVPLTTCPEIDTLISKSDLVIAIDTRIPENQLDIVKSIVEIVPDEANLYYRDMINQYSMIGNVNIVLTKLLEEIKDTPLNSIYSNDEIASVKEAIKLRISHIEPQMSFVRAIRSASPKETILIEGVNQIGYACRMGYPVYSHDGYITSSYFGNLGFAYPTALGAKVAAPDRPVVCISGDGGFLFNSQEMATAMQYGIHVVVVVFNDNAYGNVYRDQLNKYDGRVIASQLQNPDFVQLAKSYGMDAVRINEPNELEIELSKAIDRNRSCLIEVSVGMMPSPW